jgi:hypothetical protein
VPANASAWGRRSSSQRKRSGGGSAGGNAGSRRSTGPRCSSPLAQWLHDLPAMPEMTHPGPFDRQSSGGRSAGSGKGSSGGVSSGSCSGLSRIASGMEENYSVPFSQ